MPPIQSVEEWLALPKLTIPVVQNEQQKGKMYNVLKVGFAAVLPGDCEKYDIPADFNERGRRLLPTCVVRTATGEVLHQLPLSLAGWAFNAVGAAAMGAKMFPSAVEFGMLRDREYAQIL